MYPALGSERPDSSVDPGSAIARNQREGFLSYFGFRESPFGITPNPEFLFFSAIHRDAIQSMVDSIESNLGFTVLMGEPGTGKTTLLFQLMKQYQDRARIAFVFQTQCRPQDLLRYIASDLELPCRKRDEVSLHQRLNELVVKEAQAGRKVLIIVDEAQNLQPASLEAIRLLSGFGTAPSQVLHVLLSGSGRLGETLRAPELSQLAQRIATVCRLGPLTPEEAKEYVRFRVAVAGPGESRTEDIFPAESLAEVAEESGGVPRRINSICHRALSLAYSSGKHTVSRDLVQQAARDLDLAESAGMGLRVAASSRAAEKPDIADKLADRVLPEPQLVDVPISFPKEISPAVPLAQAGPPDLLSQLADELARDQAQAPALFKTNTGKMKRELPEMPPTQQTATPGAPDPLTESLKQRLYAEPGRKTVAVPAWKHWAISQRGGLKGWRSGIVLAAVLALGLGVWFGKRELRAKTPVTVQAAQPSQPQVASPRNEPSSAQPVAIAQATPVSAPVKASSQPADHKPLRSAEAGPTPEIIQTVPGTLQSRIDRQSSRAADQAAAPANITMVARNSGGPALPLTSVPASVPRLDAPSIASRLNSLQPTKLVQPEYPEKARLWHVEGDVVLELKIDRKGNVQKVRGLRGNAMLIQAAEAAAQQWHYPPQDDNAVVTQVQFSFKLNPDEKR